MAAPERRPTALPVLVAVGVLVIDQLTKHWAVNALADGRVIEIVWTLRFRLTFNTGMSFGMGEGLGPLVAPLAALVIVVLVWTVGRIPNLLGLISVGLIVGGAVGNLVDRAFRAGNGFLGGGVVDFVDLQWWPVFNVADMGIVVGAALLVLATWRADQEVEDADASRDAS